MNLSHICIFILASISIICSILYPLSRWWLEKSDFTKWSRKRITHEANYITYKGRYKRYMQRRRIAKRKLFLRKHFNQLYRSIYHKPQKANSPSYTTN